MDKYTKPPLTIKQQIQLLKSRKIVIGDELIVERILTTVGYYRLTAYLFPFRSKDASDDYVPGTSIEKVWRYYRFDRSLRFLLIDAIERIEVAVKAMIVSRFTLAYGTFGYTDTANFASPINVRRHAEMLDFIHSEMERSKEDFVSHFKAKYDTSQGLPLWMATEIMTFGNMLTFFRLMKKQDKQAIAKQFGISEQVLETWLVSLNYIRNICAHHGRIWNKVLAVRPSIPKKLLEWHESKFPVEASRIYSILTIMRFLLRTIVPQSKWPERLLTLLGDFQEIPRLSMGIPFDFEQSELWKSPKNMEVNEGKSSESLICDVEWPPLE